MLGPLAVWLLLCLISVVNMRGYIYGGTHKVYGILTNILFSMCIGWAIILFAIISETWSWIENFYHNIKYK